MYILIGRAPKQTKSFWRRGACLVRRSRQDKKGRPGATNWLTGGCFGLGCANSIKSELKCERQSGSKGIGEGKCELKLRLMQLRV